MGFINWLGKTIKSLLPYLIFLGFGVLCWQWFSFTSQSQADVVEPIVNGVIVGIVTSVLILIFSIVWHSNITPWLENLLYKDTKIEGVWNGVLVPFIGIEEIDKRRVKIAFGIIERKRRKRKQDGSNDKNNGTGIAVSASTQDNGKDRDIEAELIIKDAPDPESNKAEQDELIDRKFFIKIGSGMEPIEVRVEVKRVGHSISGQIVEIGGASDIHTYSFKGSFKNLILTGEYENEDCAHIDRGSLSLMLKRNGQSLEGFFSSYEDGDHSMAPFKCILKRQARSENGE